MRIAIIDDSATDRDALVTLLKMFFQKMDFPIGFHEFDSAELFFSDLEPELYDLCFMDIFLGGMNGMDAARRLYEIDSDCTVIFLSSSDQYIGEGYRVRALRYLLKPVTAAQIQEVLPECVERAVLSLRRLTVQVGRKEHEITFSRILYVTSSDKIEIHLANITFTLSARSTFAETTAPLIEDFRFITCCRGIVVNMAHAQRIDKDCFLMDNGERVPISRRQFAAVNDRFIDFRFEYLV